MQPANKKEIKVTVFSNFTLMDKTFSVLKSTGLKLEEDYPQLDFITMFNFHTPMLGVFLSKEEYNKFVKPLIGFGDTEPGEKNDIDFETFVQLLLNREGDKKNILLRSCFLTSLNKENASILKNIFESAGFAFKFTIIAENLFTLLAKDFTSTFYQIPLNFRFVKIEAFFQNFFKTKIKNFINGMEILTEVFGSQNISFIHDEKFLEKKILELACKNIGINSHINNNIKSLFEEIDPLFLDYMKSKIDSKGEVKLNINEEIKVIKEISDKYKLKPPSLLKGLSAESTDELEELNEKIYNFVRIEEKPITKFLSIKSETFNRRHFIPYIESI